MTETIDVVAIGEPMVEFNQLPGTDNFRRGFGGDTSNFVCAASRIGASSAYLTRIGDDEFGSLLQAMWRREKVDCSAVEIDATAPTGIYFVDHGPDGHVFSYRRAGSAACAMTYSPAFAAVVRRSRHLHVSGISQAISTGACDTVFAALADARAHGVRTSYDLNFRPRLWPAARALAIATATLAQVDLFLPSLDEAGLLLGIDEPERLIDWSHRRGARLVAVKCGAAGAVVSDGKEIVKVAPWPVTPLDATGAGDCFGGVLAARLVAGDKLPRAARAAAVAAALSTQGYGAVAPLPAWIDVEPRLTLIGG